MEQSYQLEDQGTNGLATIGQLTGPEGKRGRIVGVSAICTVAITGGPGEVSFGNAGDEAAFGVLSIPATSANQRVNGTFTPKWGDGGEPRINPNEVVDVAVTTATTLGSATFYITIEWE